jgi:LPS export ABC transporter protein LptC
MIRHLNKGGFLLLSLLLAAAALTSWLRTRPDIAAPVAETETIRQIDFFMENFSIRQYNKRGRLHYVLNGLRLNHYEEDGRAEISEPAMKLSVEDRRWTVKAELAVAAQARTAQEIRFLGNVRMHQADGLLIRTEELLLKPETEYMETLAPVVISGNGGNIEAHSLQADLQNGIHTLSTVRGRYVP